MQESRLGTFSLPCFNRLVRTRMLGGVGRAGVMPTLTRLGTDFIDAIRAARPVLNRRLREGCKPECGPHNVLLCLARAPVPC